MRDEVRINNLNKHFQTKGIIIRKVDLNEADRIVTVLTEDNGKIDCIAKGARRIKSRFCGRLDLFNHVRLTCFRGRDLAIINEVHLLDYFTDTKETTKHSVLFYLSELTSRLIQSGQHIEGVYHLLLDTLSHISSSCKTKNLFHSYLIKLLTLTGFLPVWNKCVACSTVFDLANPVYLSYMDSNPVCHKCHTSADRIIEAPLIKWINFMQIYPLSDTIKVSVAEPDHNSVWLMLQNILGNILNNPLKSEESLERV
jgi:DNA repair protein RecO (recombination protein O)